MRYTPIPGLDEIIAGASGKPKTTDDVIADINQMNDLSGALDKLIKVIKGIIAELKTFFSK